MISTWFLIIGIIFGTVCSFYAKSKNRHAENWFTLGLFFWFFAAIAVYFRSSNTTENHLSVENSEDEEFSFPY